MSATTREKKRMLSADFHAPAADIFASDAYSEEFEALKPGFDGWRVRIALLDVANLCNALDRWMSAYGPSDPTEPRPMDSEPFSQLKACIDFACLYFGILNEQCLGADEPIAVTDQKSAAWTAAARRLDPLALAAARGLTKWRHKVVVHPDQEMRFGGTLGKGTVRLQFSNFYEGCDADIDLGYMLAKKYGVSTDALDSFELMGRAYYAVPVFVEGVEGINPDRLAIEDRTRCRGISSLSTTEIVQVLKRYTWAWLRALRNASAAPGET